MANTKRRRLDSTVSALQQRYGQAALRKGSELPAPAPPPHIPTGFAALDAITGCQGVPLGALTLLSGPITSGKLTLAYKTLANAQQQAPSKSAGPTAALVDFSQSSNPAYLARCGVDLARLLIVRPQPTAQAIALLLDLIQTRQLRLLLVDPLTTLTADRAVLQRLNGALGRLALLAQQARTALLFIDEPSPAWQRWLNWDGSAGVRQVAALHLELRREQWLSEAHQLVGYQATATVRKSRWTRRLRSAGVRIVFNGTVRAEATW